MHYQIDGTRLLVLLVLLGSGMFIAVRLVRLPPMSQPPMSQPPGLESRRIAIRGMLTMTLLGLGCGLLGGLAEDAMGETVCVVVLHAIYTVCWAPVFLTSLLAEGVSGSGASSRMAGDLLGLLGLALIPVLWFLVFLGVGRLLLRRRAR
jgi:hypothetical protein